MSALNSPYDEAMDFTYLKKLLKLTDGNLGAHLSKLEEAGYIKLKKTFIDRKPRTFLEITGKGRDAFKEHIEALKKIISGKEKT
jgi:DNA-binding MarR family transcriptional regulator